MGRVPQIRPSPVTSGKRGSAPGPAGESAPVPMGRQRPPLSRRSATQVASARNINPVT